LNGSNTRVNADTPATEGTAADTSDVALTGSTARLAAKATRPTETRLTPEPSPVTVLASGYVVTTFAPRSQCALEDARHTRALVEDINQVVETEAPVHLKVIAARLLPRWDYSKVTKRVLTHLEKAIHMHEIGHLADDFVWRSADDRTGLATFRSQPAGDERKLEEIALEEFQAATLAILRQSLSVPHTELTRLVSRTLGLNRVGNRVSERANLAITLLQGSGHIVSRNDSWTLR